MPTLLTTKQLESATAGGDDFIRTKNGQIVALALRLDLNPNAPYVIIVGKGVRREHRAKLLEQQGGPFPTYLKRGINSWEYIGDYGPYEFKSDAATVQRFARFRKPDSVAGSLFLTPVAASAKLVGSDDVDKIPNRGFPDAATRKAIELAAIDFVTQKLEGEGYLVHDHQALNRGYDLFAEKKRKSLRIEVKGTDASFPRFFLTRNEYRSSLIQKNWQLRVVCEARTNPRMHEYSSAAMDQVFTLDPLAWECTPK